MTPAPLPESRDGDEDEGARLRPCVCMARGRRPHRAPLKDRKYNSLSLSADGKRVVRTAGGVEWSVYASADGVTWLRGDRAAFPYYLARPRRMGFAVSPRRGARCRWRCRYSSIP